MEIRDFFPVCRIEFWKMNRAEVVKLIYLEIVDFKQLEPGKVEWKHEMGMDFDVVNSQPGKSERI